MLAQIGLWSSDRHRGLLIRLGLDPYRVHCRSIVHFSDSAASHRNRSERLVQRLAASTRSLNGTIKTLPVPIAPLNEQSRIVAKIEELFSDLDAGVANLLRVRANLKRYRAAVLKAAVEGKLTEDWRAQHPDTEPASVLLERILTERRRKWEEDQLAKFAEAGKQPPKGWQEKYRRAYSIRHRQHCRLPDRMVLGNHRINLLYDQQRTSVTSHQTHGTGFQFFAWQYVRRSELDYSTVTVRYFEDDMQA